MLARLLYAALALSALGAVPDAHVRRDAGRASAAVETAQPAAAAHPRTATMEAPCPPPRVP